MKDLPGKEQMALLPSVSVPSGLRKPVFPRVLTLLTGVCAHLAPETRHAGAGPAPPRAARAPLTRLVSRLRCLPGGVRGRG